MHARSAQTHAAVRVFVGSTRPAKVEGAREALEAIARVDSRFANATVHPHDLTDIAPRMPMSLHEIIGGARTRASGLLVKLEPASAPCHSSTFAVGLEGGLHPLPIVTGEWSLQTWAAVTDGERWSYGAGPALLLPEFVAQRVAAGEELGDVIDALAGDRVRGTRGAWGVLTLDLISRRDAFRLAVLAAFAPFYNARGWDSLRR